MSTVWVQTPEIVNIAKSAFPDYKGKKYRLKMELTVDVRSYWSGGSRSFFNFIRLDTLEAFGAMPPQSAYDKPIKGAEAVPLLPGLVCVEHLIIAGKDYGIIIHVHPHDLPTYLPTTDNSLTERQLVVLTAARSFISSARLKEINCYGWDMTIEEYNSIRSELFNKGFMNKMGAITDSGRNALPDTLQFPRKERT